MPSSKTLRRLALALGALLTLPLLAAALAWWYLHPPHSRANGIPYGQRNGRSLTLDVLTPSNPNGIAIALMVSGSWKSGGPGSLPSFYVAPLLRSGYTVFAVCHVSQPDAAIQETFADVQRAIRFIRAHAAQYNVRPDRIGVTGGSAGGHLSLLLATRGDPGKPDAPDPVERHPSTVQAVAIFYPVTDLLDLGSSTENLHDGGPPKSYRKAFGPSVTNLVTWTNIARALSPALHDHATLPPTLIHHGLADTLTPPEQTERFAARARAAGRTVEVVWHTGSKHGWLTMPWDIRHFARWFDQHLQPPLAPDRP